MRTVNVAPYPYVTLRDARALALYWNGSIRKEGPRRYSVWASFRTAEEDAPARKEKSGKSHARDSQDR